MYYICTISTVIIIFVNIQIFKTSTSLRIIQLQEINYIRRNSIASRNARSRKTVDDTFEENFNSSQTKDNNFWLTMSLNLKHRDWEREREKGEGDRFTEKSLTVRSIEAQKTKKFLVFCLGYSNPRLFEGNLGPVYWCYQWRHSFCSRLPRVYFHPIYAAGNAHTIALSTRVYITR